MKRLIRESAWLKQARTWVVDYSAARAHAITWLGDRYLLARPMNSSLHDGGNVLLPAALHRPRTDTAAGVVRRHLPT